MSANIYWLPVKKGHDLNISAPSDFMAKFNKAFGQLPYDLGEPHLEKLRGMQAGDLEQNHDTYEDLIEGIIKYGTIKIWAEY